MPQAALPDNEEQRLIALETYDTVGRIAEGAYDDIVYLAAQIMQTPTALISLVEKDRQWFKAKYGLDACETTRDVAFCAHAILSPDKSLAVFDPVNDARFRDNELVLNAPHIRFYYGIPLVNQEGYALGTLCVLDYKERDQITEEQEKSMHALAHQSVALMESQKEARKYALAWNDASDALWDWNLLDDSVNVSHAFGKILGHEGGVVFGNIQDIISLIHPDDLVSAQKEMHDYIDNPVGCYSYQLRISHIQGQWRWYHAKANAIKNIHGKVIRMCGTLTDITEIKRLNDEQKKLNTELMEANAEFERFAYMASHDLQEPLRMVKSFTDLLEKKYADQLDSKAQHYMDIVSSSAERMRTMISDLLHYAKTENIQNEAEILSLNDILKEALEALKISCEETQAEIISDNLPDVWGHKTYITSLFQNIISNGIKYQPSNNAPYIQITCHDDDDFYMISFADNGIGMNEKHLKEIFEPFRRLHGRSEYSGTGMGLAICRKTMQKIGGSIDVTSVLGQGSIFKVSFPKNAIKHR